MTHIKSLVLVSALLLASQFAFSQNKEEVVAIVKTYDIVAIQKLQKRLAKQTEIDKKEAYEAAKRNNWPIIIKNADGSEDELMKLTADGQPLYYSVHNANAAKTSRANLLRTNGGMGLNLNGEGMTARIWDGGKTRASHQEFGSRVTVVDAIAGPSGNNFHATHVTGTVIASGVLAEAKGMAPQANARTFNWNDDMSEVLDEVQLGMLLSNHSYGTPIVINGNFLPAWYIGAYTQDARDWDEASYLSPYYLMVASAGNNGTDNNPTPSTTGYDKLTGNKVSKNNLVVANCQDAAIDASGNLISVTINSSSSEGPADDSRIKPDITGNGTNVTSTFEGNDADYGAISGTSMSAPSVTGTLLLLQQHYNNLNFNFMKAATLKAVACHTADDAGKPGPDPVFGWGLINAKKAALAISQNGLQSVIKEETLTQGQIYTMNVVSDGLNPLQASIVWTDVPGNTNNTLNSSLPSLVNDLDIRLTKGNQTYFPWKLQSNANLNATNNSDNAVDNVERIDVPLAFGAYTLTVSHKGLLQNSEQAFSLVVTGVTSPFKIQRTSPDVVACNNQNAVFNFDYVTTTTQPTNFSITNLPAGAVANLNVSSATMNQPIVMTFSDLQNVPNGTYTIGLMASNALKTETVYVALQVFNNTFGNLVLTSPTNNSNGIASTVQLEWEPSSNAITYQVQLSTTNNFSNLIVDQNTEATHYLVSNLTPSTQYFWRALPQNICGAALSNTVNSFVTGVVSCGNVFTATDFSDAVIGTSQGDFATVPIIVTGGMTIADIKVTLNISHTYIEDMTIYLEGPDAIGNPFIRLFEEPCGDNDDINATLSDNGVPYTCGNSPAISGVVLPVDPFSDFNNLAADGVWTLYAFDNYNGDGGVVNNFSMEICKVEPSILKTNDLEMAAITVYPNPSKGILNIQLPFQSEQQAVLDLYDIQGRKIMSRIMQSENETVNIGSLSAGVYLLSIENGTNKTTKKIILEN